jgi:hypothetical protein
MSLEVADRLTHGRKPFRVILKFSTLFRPFSIRPENRRLRVRLAFRDLDIA